MQDLSFQPLTLPASQFSFVRLTPSEMEDCYRLRFEVYCRQARLFPEEKYPEGRETDEYDEDAIHVGAYDCRGVLVGALRLIRSPTLDLPMFRYCQPADLDCRLSFSAMAIAEVSRLSVLRPLPRDSVADRQTGAVGNRRYRPWSARSLEPVVLAGLVYRAYQESRREDIEQLVVAMEPALHRRLKRIDVHFDPVGAPFDYYGEVRPYRLSVAAFEAGLISRNPALKSAAVSDIPTRLRSIQKPGHGVGWAA